MAIETKDLLELMGFEKEVETIDEAKEAFHEMWLSKNVAHKDKDVRSKVAGEVLGAATTKMKSIFGLEGDEIKDKKIEDLVQLASEKMQKQIDEAKAKGGKTDDERVKQLESEKADLQKKAKEEEALRVSLAQQLADKDASFAKEKKDLILNDRLTKIKSAIPFAKEIPQVAKIGFDSLIQSKYNFDLNEKDEVVATDKEGNQIMNANKTGYLSAEELIKIEAAKENLIAKSNGGSNEKKTETIETQPAGTKRQIHPNALKAVQ
jgi:hypothetical protein